MTQRPYDTGQSATGAGGILLSVRDGMHVHDVNDKHIGHVEFVYFGAANDDAVEASDGMNTPVDMGLRDHNSLVDLAARAFAGDGLPEVLRNRLLHNGFIRVEGEGLFSSDRYVTPEQIASISDDKVHLNVTRDQLVKD